MTPAGGALHDDELVVDPALVRRLVARDRPDWGARPVRPLDASGSSNALFRLGDDLLVRVPRQPGGTSIDTEARWLPVVGPALSVAVPEVVHVGEPGFGHPTRWSVVRWLDGAVPGVPARGDRRALARDLAGVVLPLRDLDVPPEARSDPDLSWYRCQPLANQDEDFRHSLAACRRLDDPGLDLDRVEATWDGAMALPAASGVRPSWLHGDLVAENLLVRDGRLSAVLDFGGLGIGDPTVDLVVA